MLRKKLFKLYNEEKAIQMILGNLSLSESICPMDGVRHPRRANDYKVRKDDLFEGIKQILALCYLTRGKKWGCILRQGDGAQMTGK